jgi:hypothetical protein
MVRKSRAAKAKADQESAYPACFDGAAGRQAGGAARAQDAGHFPNF